MNLIIPVILITPKHHYHQFIQNRQKLCYQTNPKNISKDPKNFHWSKIAGVTYHPKLPASWTPKTKNARSVPPMPISNQIIHAICATVLKTIPINPLWAALPIYMLKK